MSTSLSDYLTHYKERLQKNPGDVNNVKHAVEKLDAINVTIDVTAIMKTGTYQVVRELAKTPGPWNDTVKPLYEKWKALLIEKEKQKDLLKAAENNLQSRSQNNVSKISYNERVQPSINTVNESLKSIPNKLVTNGANYPVKSSVAQDNIYIQNKGNIYFQNKSSDNQRNKDVIINNGANYPSKLTDIDRNVSAWNKDVKPSENHGNKPVIMNNTANISGNFSNFEEQGSTWSRSQNPPENFACRSTGNSNDADYSTHLDTNEIFPVCNRGMKSPENSASNLSKFDCDKSVHYTNERTGLSKFENSSFTTINGYHQGLQNQSQLRTTQSNFKVVNNTHPPINNFHPPVNNSLVSAHSKYGQNSAQHQNSFSAIQNAHSSINALSPRSSKHPVDTGGGVTASPNKTGRLPNPYEIEMKEGMFRAVKSSETMPFAIARVKQLYNQDDLRDSWDYAPRKSKSKPEETKQTPKIPKEKDQSKTKSAKSPKVSSGKKSSEKKSHSSKNNTPKSKSSTPDKLRTNCENPTSRSEKRKLNLSDSAIKKSHSEKRVKDDSGHLTENSCSPISPPKFSIKKEPSSKANSPACKESQTLSSEKNSNTHKSNVNENMSSKSRNSFHNKESQPAKCDNKMNSPIVVSIKLEYLQNYENKSSSSHKSCDKAPSKGLSDEAAERFISSKKDRTSVYSGKKSVQEIEPLKALCIQMLKKNVENMKFNYPVPYEQIRPVLTHFTASKLKKIEENNPYLLEDSDGLWKSFCKRKFPSAKHQPNETWRQLYWRTRGEQDKKLKDVTSNISANMSKAASERQMKIAVIESPKPPYKRMKLSEPKTQVSVVKASSSKETLNHKISFKESEPKTQVSAMKASSSKETLNHKKSIKESLSSHSKISKESSSSNQKKTKKGTFSSY